MNGTRTRVYPQSHLPLGEVDSAKAAKQARRIGGDFLCRLSVIRFVSCLRVPKHSLRTAVILAALSRSRALPALNYQHVSASAFDRVWRRAGDGERGDIAVWRLSAASEPTHWARRRIVDIAVQ